MPEFKIEPDALNERRDAKRRLVSWSIVLLLFAMTVSIYTLGFLGLLSVDSDLRWLACVGQCPLFSVWLSVPLFWHSAKPCAMPNVKWFLFWMIMASSERGKDFRR